MTFAALLVAMLGAAPHKERSALDQLAADCSARVLRHAPEAPVGVYVGAESKDLARAFATLLSAELARHGRAPLVVDAESPGAAELAARQKRARALVRLTLSLSQGTLHAQGDLLGTWVNFWSGAIPTRPPAPAAVLVASFPADEAALALASSSSEAVHSTPEPNLQLLNATFARLSLPIAALAAGDVTGDGKDEVVAVTDEDVVLFSPSGQRLAHHDHRSQPLSPTVVREPFGAASIQRGRVSFTSGRRAKGETLAFAGGTLKATGTTDDAVLDQNGVRLVGRISPGKSSFLPNVTTDSGNFVLPAPFTTHSQMMVGTTAHYLFVFADGSATVSRNTPGGEATLSFAGMGAGSALVDVDSDGVPELVTSGAAADSDPDSLRVLSPLNGGALRWQGAIPKGRILHVVGADLDGDRTKEIVMGVWHADGSGEIHVFRRAPR